MIWKSTSTAARTASKEGSEAGLRLRGYLFLFAGGLVVAVLAASLQAVPGYMDASYYYAGAQRLAAGQGVSEPYLWNYLNDPTGLPVPSFGYWMPLVSLVAAAGITLLPAEGFWPARLFFILMAGLIPVLAAALSYRLVGRVALAWLSGILALFPGFYLAYLTTTDAFAIYMLAGGMIFWIAARPPSAGRWQGGLTLVALGLLAGAMHLARADGIIWLPAALAAAAYRAWPGGRRRGWRQLVVQLGLVLAAYLAVMAPWFWRNAQQWGSLFPPGGSRTLWLVEYEQTMIYPASLLTPAAWMEAGWSVHAAARWEAFINNLQSTVAVQGGIVLLPFVLAGLWKLRSCFVVRLAAGMWLLTFAIMTLVFPFAGTNGAYFHSGAAFQALWWALAPLGLQIVVLWLARLRRWERAQQVFRFVSILLVAVGVLLSAGLFWTRVIGSAPDGWNWTRSDAHYRQVEQRLADLGARPGQRVMVNDPPTYYLSSGREAIVIPDGGDQMLLAAARQFQIDYLILEDRNPIQLSDLYHLRNYDDRLEYLEDVGTTRLFRVNWQAVQP